MLKVIFTLDYEIHGNGDGCPYALMVEPTNRLMRQFESYGAKLTIMADVAEILKFKEYKEQFGRDGYYYDAIAEQLRDAIHRGHDVQLHLHSSYFNAQYKDGRWEQDWSEYNFATLPFERLDGMVRTGKTYLEDLLKPVDSRYACVAFRAANWSVSPSRNVVGALIENGIEVDTSIFKYGRRVGLVNFDYANACSSLVPWRVKADDICQHDPNGRLLECPIYSENRWLGAFLTPQRLYRGLVSRFHRVSRSANSEPPAPEPANKPAGGQRRKLWSLRGPQAWKADFNQCSGGQLIRALQRAEVEHRTSGPELPFVLIGHSKLFTRFNERSLRSFLSYVAGRPQRFGFARFSEVNLKSLGASAAQSLTAAK